MEKLDDLIKRVMLDPELPLLAKTPAKPGTCASVRAYFCRAEVADQDEALFKSPRFPTENSTVKQTLSPTLQPTTKWSKTLVDIRRTEMTIAVVDWPVNDPNPMSRQYDHRKNAEVKVAHRGNIAADKGNLLALAERWLRPADQLDYMIRRWSVPVPSEVNRNESTFPVV